MRERALVRVAGAVVGVHFVRDGEMDVWRECE